MNMFGPSNVQKVSDKFGGWKKGFVEKIKMGRTMVFNDLLDALKEKQRATLHLHHLQLRF